MSYSLYFSISKNIHLETSLLSENQLVETIIDTQDCVLLCMSLIYFKKFNDELSLKKLKGFALDIKNDYFDSFWIFLYEIFDVDELDGEWKNLKNKQISFLRRDIFKL